MNIKHNYLKLIIGCMFSSKTSTLLNEIDRYKHITDNIIIVNSYLDNRYYTEKDSIASHNKIHYPAIKLRYIKDLISSDKYKDAEIVLIDEAQFFPDLYDVLSIEINKTHEIPKKYIIAGLSSDFNMKPIGDIIKFVPMANEILHLKALCLYCKDGTLANFTKLRNKRYCEGGSGSGSGSIIIGNDDKYTACCRYHYLAT